MNDKTAKSDAGKPTYTLVPPANTAKHIEAINTAIRALGGKQRWRKFGNGQNSPKKR